MSAGPPTSTGVWRSTTRGTGARTTRGRAWVLLHTEKFRTRRQAMSREWYLKRDRKFRKALALTISAPRPSCRRRARRPAAAPTATPPACGASSITCLTTGSVFATSPSGTSKISSSCTCSSICAPSFAFASAGSMRIMARRMMSAAVPCSRALIAARSLKARIDGLRGGDVGVVALAPEQRHHIAVLLGERLGLFHVVADAGEALEIFLDVGAGLLARDAELVGEAEGRDAVDDAEIDRLGAAAHLGRHALDRHAEHFRRGHGVDVEAVAERLAQRRDVGDLGEQPQLDLRVVGGDELVARRRR